MIDDMYSMWILNPENIIVKKNKKENNGNNKLNIFHFLELAIKNYRSEEHTSELQSHHDIL